MPIQSDAESSPPKRGSADELGQPLVKVAPRQFRWRAIIHAGAKLDPTSRQPSVAWHLAECDEPGRPERHCPIGQHLISLDGNPDGHCQVGGACPRCPDATAATAPPEA
jgi:hypothetical protein